MWPPYLEKGRRGAKRCMVTCAVLKETETWGPRDLADTLTQGASKTYQHFKDLGLGFYEQNLGEGRYPELTVPHS